MCCKFVRYLRFIITFKKVSKPKIPKEIFIALLLVKPERNRHTRLRRYENYKVVS